MERRKFGSVVLFVLFVLHYIPSTEVMIPRQGFSPC